MQKLLRFPRTSIRRDRRGLLATFQETRGTRRGWRRHHSTGPQANQVKTAKQAKAGSIASIPCAVPLRGHCARACASYSSQAVCVDPDDPEPRSVGKGIQQGPEARGPRRARAKKRPTRTAQPQAGAKLGPKADKGQAKTQVLVREFIRESLYNPQTGYFTQTDCVSSPSEPIRFTELWGRWDYTLTLQNLYATSKQAWSTPVEIFQPWYSYAIANYISTQHTCQSHPLNIVEVGGGNGTNALHILSFFKQNHPQIYDTMR